MKVPATLTLLLSFSLVAFAGHGTSALDQISPTPFGDAKSAKTQGTAEGTFLRIDEGDYFHFVMKDKKGEEQSYFILKPDPSVETVIDSPEKYVGKKCRVTFLESEEFLPEAGQKMKISQVLKVKWLE